MYLNSYAIFTCKYKTAEPYSKLNIAATSI